jgi:nitroreductase
MAIFAIGAIAQTVCLAALNYGLGTCIEDQGIRFPEVVRKFTHIPESKRIIAGIAIGYPDWDNEINKDFRGREPLDTMAGFYGF